MSTYYCNGYVIEAPNRIAAERCADILEARGFERDYYNGALPPPDYPAWLADDECHVTGNKGDNA
jgi:hypothetical protein